MERVRDDGCGNGMCKYYINTYVGREFVVVGEEDSVGSYHTRTRIKPHLRDACRAIRYSFGRYLLHLR
jgi:hypothetical protein